MYAIAIIRYRRPLDEILAAQDDHRAYVRDLKARGVVVAGGPLEPRSGGALLLRVPDERAHATLDEVRDGDPYYKRGLAQYELLPWQVGTGREDLDRI